ncbi:hypothetical protein FRC14_000061 [Serendipita sp. 396]|nr:hypothetical protein FRC14_000061 [Serendipita sp. 396]KAG8789858.1 hypothetical protein FRC15_000050 [Serendipita sp. 397]KAG8804800.1 hypothetical protein FRC16_000054 [Serendipita sp. 398]KAG8826326.1 hypothetical protein FRC19_009286 [Serendipita sp. 401]KAG8847220.1 hypothetical protein FRB91_011989 [Serendipita sp. 411]KAG8879470.1 hypothetical protein FRC20_000042 [Serendipita sp. 405]KAG9057065.1 hypothetical protein FS842_008727 [Serendipita sp. 407]
MRFTILATIFATAATVVLAVPAHIPQTTTSAVPAGTPSQHSALVLGSGSEEPHKNLMHHHQHDGKEEGEEENKEEELTEPTQHVTEHHPSLSRRLISMEDAQAHAKSYKKIEKTHMEAAHLHANTANNNPELHETHMALAVNHATLSTKANHLHQAYAHEVKAQKSEAKAAAAVPGSAAHRTHTNNAANARVVSNHHFAQANAIQGVL